MSDEIDAKFILNQKERLLGIRQDILNKLNSSRPEEIDISADQIVEEGDQAQAILNQSLAIDLRERDLRKLREIDLALSKIGDGTYGYCEESGDPIEKKRLEKQPWARLCLYEAEIQERESRKYRAG